MTDTSTTIRQAPATRVEQIATLLGGFWLTIGIFVDGYAHENIIDTATEDFLTPWHALFYSGFLATAAWMVVVALRRQRAPRFVDRFPPGYRLGAVGIGLFALGGIGDGIWHTIYGVETSIDALLSPTHLLLFVGLLLILSAPLRASWVGPDVDDGWRQLAIPVVSIALCAALVAFFFTYVWGLSANGWLGVTYEPDTGFGEGAVNFGMTASLVSTIVLVAPIVLLLRRWSLPFGTVAGIWTVVAALEKLAFEGDDVAIPAALVGGLAFDLLLRWPSGPRRWIVRAAAFTAPVVMWTTWMWLSRNTPGIAMPVEIWMGVIVFAGLAGLGLALIGFPPPDPERSPGKTGDH